MVNVFFGDRIGRLPYFLWMLAVCIVLSPIQIYVGRNLYGDEASAVLLLTRIICAGVAAFPIVKRLHDLNKSGWLWLLALIPLVNLFFGIYLLFGKGTEGANDYGDPPEKFLKKRQIGSSSNVSYSDDDTFYQKAYEELENGQTVKALWAKIFAQCGGNENKAKAIYINRRVAQLAEEAKLTATQAAEEAKLTAMQEVLDAKAVSWEVVDERWVKNIYANGDVTMSDKDTGRMWIYRADLCHKNPWSAAVAYCDNLTYAGYSDWRLPDKDELEEQFGQKGFFAGAQSSNYWSSASTPRNTGSAWCVDMSCGRVDGFVKTNDNYVWPVRGGQ